jgi:23S rRNA (uridine2552-2'-O)-methyltransferase
MKRSKSSRRWLDEHFDDPYVKQAQAEGWRSRAVFKLKELNERDQLIRPGLKIVDLGAAPGGWSQMARKLMGAHGTVIATDILPIEPIAGVAFVHGDFREDAALSALETHLQGGLVDLVMSDMAPNMSGTESVDQARSMHLAELAIEFARKWLRPDGCFVTKLFQGQSFDLYVRDIRGDFASVVTRKPKASRPRSREVYLVGKGFRGARLAAAVSD